jgi:3-phenylpropionate/trans-cinnamate dioxygenase ferredoxin subunit
VAERYVVGKAGDLPPGERKIVTINGLSLGVFNIHGEYYALINRCSHQGGPLCLGDLVGLILPSEPGEYRWSRPGEILRCPWHAWEFDVKTGKAVVDPQKQRVKTYEVTVEPYVPPDVPTYPVTVESGWLVVHV